MIFLTTGRAVEQYLTPAQSSVHSSILNTWVNLTLACFSLVIFPVSLYKDNHSNIVYSLCFMLLICFFNLIIAYYMESKRWAHFMSENWAAKKTSKSLTYYVYSMIVLIERCESSYYRDQLQTEFSKFLALHQKFSFYTELSPIVKDILLSRSQ